MREMISGSARIPQYPTVQRMVHVHSATDEFMIIRLEL